MNIKLTQTMYKMDIIGERTVNKNKRLRNSKWPIDNWILLANNSKTAERSQQSNKKKINHGVSCASKDYKVLEWSMNI